MSWENVERVRRAYAEPGPLTALAASAAPDVEIDLTAVYPDQPVLRGIDEARRFRDTSPWGASQRFESERYFDVDDERVLVFVRGTATGQGSDAPVEAGPHTNSRFATGCWCASRCTSTAPRPSKPPGLR